MTVPDLAPARQGFTMVPDDLLLQDHAPAVTIAVYVSLRSFAGKRCNPSHASIAKRIGVSPRAVRGALAWLQERGWVTWSRTGSSNDYKIAGPDRQEVPVKEPDRQEVPIGSAPRAERIGTRCRQTKPTEPDPLNQRETSSLSLVLPIDKPPDLFDQVWADWPKKVEKKAAKAAWTVAVKKHPPDQIAAAARRYAKVTEPKYVQHLHRWLQRERWEDEATATPLRRPKAVTPW